MSKLKRGILWVLIGLCGVGIAMIIVPNFIPPTECTRSAEIISNTRTIATAVAAYILDKEELPNSLSDLKYGGYLNSIDDWNNKFKISRITSNTVTINYHGPALSGTSVLELQSAACRRVTRLPGGRTVQQTCAENP